MTQEEYIKAANFWVEKDAAGKKLTKDDLIKKAEEYLSSNNTCALATASGDFVRCTPIEYHYFNKALWIFSEGGEKFNALKDNKNVCAAVFDKFTDNGNLRGMQITGTARIIEPFSKEYINAAERRKIKIEVLRKLNTPMNLICVDIKKIEFTNSQFAAEGFYIRQKLEF